MRTFFRADHFEQKVFTPTFLHARMRTYQVFPAVSFRTVRLVPAVSKVCSVPPRNFLFLQI